MCEFWTLKSVVQCFQDLFSSDEEFGLCTKIISFVAFLPLIGTTALDYSQWIWNVTISFLPDYIDANFLGWIVWLFTPIAVMFILPIVICMLFYFSGLVLHIYRHRQRLRDAYANDFYDGAKSFIATIWEGHGWLWHGYEVLGMEKIPDAALIIYYHGAMPVDLYYLMAKYYLYKKKLISAVGDRFLFKLPGLKLFFEVFKVTPGTVDDCAASLQRGELLSIAPGGVVEAQFGDQSYELLWGNRIGFAKVALKAKVPIIPVFTRNIRESFRTVNIAKNLFRKLYKKTKLPMVPIYGGFPVKMQTIIGDPIPYDPSLSPQQLADKTADSIRQLIVEHQRVPGSIFGALMDRFR